MRKILQIAWNDIRVEFSERSTLIFFLVLPLVFTAILGSSMGDGGDSSADNRYPVLVVDTDESALSSAFGETLEASQVIRPVFTSAEEAIRLLDEEGFPAALTIPAGFGDRLRAGEDVALPLRRAPNDNRVLAVEQALQAAMSDMNSAVVAARASTTQAAELRPFPDPADREAYFAEAFERARARLSDPPARAETRYAPEVNTASLDGFEQASAGQLVTWTLITLVGAAYVFVDERLGGTLRRLLITPTRRASVVLGKITGRLGMGLLQMALLIVAGGLLFGVNWGRSPLALAVMAAAFALAAVALGVALAAFAQTRPQANGMTILFSMLLAALGGAWWPLEVTPETYQTVVRALPTTWAMLGFTDVIVRGQGVAAVLPEAGVLLLFALGFFALGVWRLRLT